MSAIDDLIAAALGTQGTDYFQPVVVPIGTFVAALKQIQGGLSPSGPELANTIYAGPASGASAAPAFRFLSVNDLGAITGYTPTDILFASATGGITTSNGLAWNSTVGAVVINSQALASVPAPQSTTALQILGNNAGSRQIEFTTNAAPGVIGNYRYNGTFAAPTGVSNGNPLLTLFGNGWGTTGVAATNPALVAMVASENWTDTARGCQIQFSTTLIGTLIRSGVFSILDTGATVTIGSSSAAAFIPTSTAIPSMGMYVASTGIIGFSVGGVAQFSIAGSFAGSLARSPLLRNATASATTPTVVPDQSASTTGMGAQSAGLISLIIAGAEALRIVSPTLFRQMGTFGTVAALPAAGNRGTMSFVTDALAPTFGAALTGGGAVFAPVYDDGTIWRFG